MAIGRPRIAFRPPSSAVKGLILVNAALFLLGALLGSGVFEGGLSWWLSLSSEGLFDGYGLGLLRFVTYQFVHSYGDVRHILYNMFGLYLFGTFVENEVGRSGLLRLYFASGFVGGAIQLGLGALLGQPIHVMGASGCVYGIAVYAAFMAPRLPVLWTIQLAWLVGAMVFVGVYETILTFRENLPSSVAHGAHLGGALWGLIAFKRFRHLYVRADDRPHPWVQWYHSWRARRAREDDAAQQVAVDQVLEKVHREGMSALTPAERKTLERASRTIKKR